MKYLPLIVVLSALVVANFSFSQPQELQTNSSNNEENPLFELNNVDQRIINGHNAYLGQFPFIVFLRNRGTRYCGGSIIAKFWILTAGHCVVDNNGNVHQTSDITIVAGGIRSDGADGIEYQISRIFKHESFQPHQLYNDDIALLKVQGGINFITGRVEMITLEQGSFKEHYAQVAGWGEERWIDGMDMKIAFQLKYTFFNVMPFLNCSRIAGLNKICSLPNRGNGVCRGDSGGPMFYNSSNEYILIGVASYITGASLTPAGYRSACGTGSIEVYTKVSSYLDWIQKITSRYTDDFSSYQSFALKIINGFKWIVEFIAKVLLYFWYPGFGMFSSFFTG